MTGPTPIVPNGHSPAIGRYSPAIAVPLDGDRRLVFITGQVATDAAGATVGHGNPGAQARVVFQRLDEVLRAAGGSLADLVSVTIYLTDINDFAEISQVRNELLGTPPPASTLVEVSRLAIADHLVEISGVAVIAGGGLS